LKYDPNAYDTPPYAAVDDPAADHKTAAIAFDEDGDLKVRACD
jgi:hypothetical protein